MNDIWIYVNATHGSFNSMHSDCVAKHQQNAPGTNLGVTYNVAGTRALVKVAGGNGWSPGWMNAPFVIKVYTEADHDDFLPMSSFTSLPRKAASGSSQTRNRG